MSIVNSSSSQKKIITPSSSNHKRHKSGESSYLRLCGICFESKRKHELFRVENCSHSFCSDCITKYISAKLQQNVASVSCPTPGCKGVLEFDKCKAVIPKKVVDRWDKALTESLIPDSQKFYCPFKDCSALMIREAGAEVIRKAECLECHRLFCAQCRSSWHSGRTCSSVSGSGREDSMFLSLAKKKKWAKCPQCKFYVERSWGCAHMVCRCKYEFCYECGKQWSLLHPCRPL